MRLDTSSTPFLPPKSKAPETLGISGAWQGDLERAKGIELFSVACQFVLNPLNTGFPLSSRARFVAIRPYKFDIFSTLAAKAAL